MTNVLLATCTGWPDGEPGAPALEQALTARGLSSRWVAWDDETVDWSRADVVAVRSTWDYVNRYAEFVAWARRAERETLLLNGADVFAWNLDKAYLANLDGASAVPTMTADSVAELAEGVRRFGTAVVKPRVGGGGSGVLVFDDPDDPNLGRAEHEHPLLPRPEGPWVVQPLVESVRTEGETSVFVLGGRAVSQVDKLPAGDEIRVHEHFGGSSRPVPLRPECADLATEACTAASRMLDRTLHYGRVDMMRLADGSLAISELELIEPGLYLDVLPGNAEPFAEMVARTIS